MATAFQNAVASRLLWTSLHARQSCRRDRRADSAPGAIQPPAWLDVVAEDRTRYLGFERRAGSGDRVRPCGPLGYRPLHG